MKTHTKEKALFRVLIAALIAYTIKSIFVGADIDEAYGVTLGYRLVQGDRLMWDMWEPHQTSAIFTALFIRLIMVLTGGSLNYMTIFLRVCFFLIQTVIALYLYKSFKECLPHLSKWEQILFAMVYYITTPKCNYVPEYSNLHMWFSTLMVLFFMQYFCSASRNRGKVVYLVLAGVCMACDVLAYPGMVLLFPFCAGFVLVKQQSGKEKVQGMAAFVLPCVIGAGVFMGYILSYMSIQDIQTVLPCILGDGSHQMTVVEKCLYWLAGFGKLFGMIAGCGIVAVLLMWVAGLIRRMRSAKREQGGSEACSTFGTCEKNALVSRWLISWFVVQIVFQIICWLDSDYNSGYPQIAYIAVPLFGWFVWRRSKVKSRTGICMIGFSLVNYIALNVFSNWEPACLNVYLVLGLFGGFLCYRQYFQEKLGDVSKRIMQVLCVIFILVEVFGRCLLMIGGDEGCKMTYQVRGISREGVRGGIFTSYMNAYRYNDNYERFAEIVPEGSMVLYLGPSQFYYMMGDCRIGAPTTISTPEYDESLKLYYELHPERMPDVVVMESCYGDVSYFADDDYIFEWLEQEYVPTEVTDYPYVRVYRR